MTFRRDFGTDPLTGAKQTFVIDDENHFSIVTETDIQPILEANYEDRKTGDGAWGGSWDKDGETFVRFARIPLDIYYNEKLLPKWIRNDPKELLKWLQRSEQEVFRTRTGTFL